MTPPARGHFVLHTNVMPPVTAGDYELVTSHTGTPFPVQSDTTHITVAAPRYQMPTDQILSTFPPANAEGAFGDRLPQIVLKRRTLPWERNPAGSMDPSPVPWLALVVVAEGEAELSTAVPVAQCVTSGTNLLDPQDKDVEQGLYLAVTETVKNKIFPCEQDLPLLCHVREVDVSDTELAMGDDDGWLAVVLANRLPVYDSVQERPVRYLACLVNLEGQLDVLPPPEPPRDHFDFELAQDWMVVASAIGGPDPVVMGTLDVSNVVLPQAQMHAGPMAAAPERAVVDDSARRQVTALDGAATLTNQPVTSQWASKHTADIAAAAMDPDAVKVVRETMGNGFYLPISVLAQEPVFRFPVLAHWSFTTSGDETFQVLMQRLDVGLLGTEPEPDPTAPPSPQEPLEVVETGHLGLGHRTRRGDPVRAWYRGPLVPFPTERDVPDQADRLPVAHASDQLSRVVPDGRQDVTLAAAFEIGRLLGLSQLTVVSALVRFRAAQFGVGRVHTILDSLVDVNVPSLIDSLDPFHLGRFVALSTLDKVAGDPATMVGPRRPLVDPGRPLRIEGDLDRVVATGLGLDLGDIAERANAVGIVAALGSTAVPTAGEYRTGVDGLRGSLATELGHVVSVAAGPITVRGPQAQRPPDALDELLDRLGGD